MMETTKSKLGSFYAVWLENATRRIPHFVEFWRAGWGLRLSWWMAGLAALPSPAMLDSDDEWEYQP